MDGAALAQAAAARRAGPTTLVDLGSCEAPVIELATELLSVFRQQLRHASTLSIDRAEPLEAMIGVPANANSNQRFLTAEAFRAAGFQVLGMLNEPSAASVEYGHRERAKSKAESRRLLVYDLGGGTFDASLVEMDGDAHTVIASAGLADLGGDDFDEILADLALEAAGRERESVSGSEFFQLMEECRERKEALNPNTRRIVVDLERVRAGWGEVSIGVAPYYERCRPLTERTTEVVQEMLAAHPEQSIETLYVTGGGSELPAVARVLKETFGRVVRRSAYMRSATAIGLAISAGGEPKLYTARPFCAPLRSVARGRSWPRGDLRCVVSAAVSNCRGGALLRCAWCVRIGQSTTSATSVTWRPHASASTATPRAISRFGTISSSPSTRLYAAQATSP